ncbi:hypothetical protein THAOC_14532 [Thalassiosira oceanica]|uniref:Uncharacterized protein n=1 Tax=Thalassiosira oceanica TaxID=159749 RepID=K0T2U7_THAOC|nr:hypothetical protein THAOC_14532 [Thalassiosira oceanica]|eukprot:EJK64707.1 hypothetical protein THAOC_14532 [Thalassiosira oceanica]
MSPSQAAHGPYAKTTSRLRAVIGSYPDATPRESGGFRVLVGCARRAPSTITLVALDVRDCWKPATKRRSDDSTPRSDGMEEVLNQTRSQGDGAESCGAPRIHVQTLHQSSALKPFWKELQRRCHHDERLPIISADVPLGPVASDRRT